MLGGSGSFSSPWNSPVTLGGSPSIFLGGELATREEQKKKSQSTSNKPDDCL